MPGLSLGYGYPGRCYRGREAARGQEAEVLWGSEAKDAFVPLNRCVRKYGLSMRRWCHDRYDDQYEYSKEEWRKVDAVIWADPDEQKDEFWQGLQSAVRKLDEFVRPHLAT